MPPPPMPPPPRPPPPNPAPPPPPNCATEGVVVNVTQKMDAKARLRTNIGVAFQERCWQVERSACHDCTSLRPPSPIITCEILDGGMESNGRFACCFPRLW